MKRARFSSCRFSGSQQRQAGHAPATGSALHDPPTHPRSRGYRARPPARGPGSAARNIVPLRPARPPLDDLLVYAEGTTQLDNSVKDLCASGILSPVGPRPRCWNWNVTQAKHLHPLVYKALLQRAAAVKGRQAAGGPFMAKIGKECCAIERMGRCLFPGIVLPVAFPASQFGFPHIISPYYL